MTTAVVTGTMNRVGSDNEIGCHPFLSISIWSGRQLANLCWKKTRNY